MMSKHVVDQPKWLPAGIARDGDVVTTTAHDSRIVATVRRDGKLVWAGEIIVALADDATPSISIAARPLT